LPRDENEIGALWKKSSANGDYFTGTINGVNVVVFPNKYKTETKHPDWRVLKAKPKADVAPKADGWD
jgi:uncharacterized protein (DUF736 family)